VRSFRRGMSELNRSELVGGDHLAAVEGDGPSEGGEVDGRLDEPDRAVPHQGVDAAGVVGERFLVGAAVAPLGRASGRPGAALADELGYRGGVVRLPRHAEGVTWIGPAPEPVLAFGDA